MQRSLVRATLNEANELRDRASAARAYAALEDTLRVIRMKPKPKDLDVSPEAESLRMKIAGRPLLESAGFDPETPEKPVN